MNKVKCDSNIVKKGYLAIMVIALVSCLDNNRVDTVDFTVNSLVESTIDSHVLSYSIIPLETNEDSKINIAKKVIVENDQLYILNHYENRQEILVFSTKGEYIDKIYDLSIIDFDGNEYSVNKTTQIIYPGQVLSATDLLNTDIDFDSYVYNVDYFESDKTQLSTFTYSNGNYIGIRDKRSKKSILFNMLLDPSCKCDVKLNIRGAYKNCFILAVSRLKIKSILNLMDKDRMKCTNSEVFNNIDRMKPGDNPILLLLEFESLE